MYQPTKSAMGIVQAMVKRPHELPLTSWTTPGGTVAPTVSGRADTTGVAADGPVLWDAATSGNARMIADVQGWIDTPSGNHGWRITASDETTGGSAQRFYAAEAGSTPGSTAASTTAPTLVVTYAR